MTAGFGPRIWSRCLVWSHRWSELLNEERPFTEEEKAFFDKQAHHAYADFRNKVPMPGLQLHTALPADMT